MLQDAAFYGHHLRRNFLARINVPHHAVGCGTGQFRRPGKNSSSQVAHRFNFR